MKFGKSFGIDLVLTRLDCFAPSFRMSACTSAGEMNLVTTAGLELMAYPPDLGPENMKPKHSPSFDNSPKSSEVLHLGKDLDGPTLHLVQNLTNAEAILNPPCSTVEIQGAESVPNR